MLRITTLLDSGLFFYQLSVGGMTIFEPPEIHNWGILDISEALPGRAHCIYLLHVTARLWPGGVFTSRTK